MKHLYLLTMILFLNACSHSATIQMADGRAHEAEIVDGDSEFLYVRNELQKREFSIREEGLTKLKKVDVVEIDHPGNVHLLVGGLLAGAGVLNAVGALAVWSEAPRDEFNEFLAYQLLGNALVYLAVGVPLGVWGWSTWDGSRSSASGVGHYSVPAQPRLLLVPNVDAKNSKLGLGLLLSF